MSAVWGCTNSMLSTPKQCYSYLPLVTQFDYNGPIIGIEANALRMHYLTLLRVTLEKNGWILRWRFDNTIVVEQL